MHVNQWSISFSVWSYLSRCVSTSFMCVRSRMQGSLRITDCSSFRYTSSSLWNQLPNYSISLIPLFLLPTHLFTSVFFCGFTTLTNHNSLTHSLLALNPPPSQILPTTDSHTPRNWLHMPGLTLDLPYYLVFSSLLYFFTLPRMHCASVCLLSYLKNHMSKLHKIVCTLPIAVTTMQYVMYCEFCRRHCFFR